VRKEVLRRAPQGSKVNASKGGKSRNEEDSGEESASSSGSDSDSEEDSSPQTTGDSNNTDEDDELKKIQQSIMDDGNAAIDNLVETDVEYAHQADQTKGMTDKVRHMDVRSSCLPVGFADSMSPAENVGAHRTTIGCKMHDMGSV